MKIEEKIDKYLNEGNMMKIFAAVEDLKKIAKNNVVKRRQVDEVIANISGLDMDDLPDIEDALEDEGITIK